MSFAIAALAHLFQSVPATVFDDASRWRDCSSVETPRGIVIVDNIAFAFFESGSASITDRGAAMLDGFLSRHHAPSHCEVVVAGHADRAGPAAQNLLLSERRANAVIAYLRQKGLSAPIVIESHGESNPLVETSDGVAEAQNRSVTVWVRDPPQFPR